MADDPGSLLWCRLSTELPAESWARHLTEQRPHEGFEFLGEMRLSLGGVLDEVRGSAPPSELPLEALVSSPGVRRIEPYRGPNGGWLLRIFQSRPLVPEAFGQCGMIPRWPARLRDGRIGWVMAGATAALRHLAEELDRAGQKVRIEACRHPAAPNVPEGLTRRQSELLARAFLLGYFEVPRRISLTEMSRRFGLAKSTLSQSLARAERAVIAEAAGARPEERAGISWEPPRAALRNLPGMERVRPPGYANAGLPLEHGRGRVDAREAVGGGEEGRRGPMERVGARRVRAGRLDRAAPGVWPDGR